MLSLNELKQLQACLKGLSGSVGGKCESMKTSNSNDSNPNLLLEMAQTASLLSQQLIQLHSQLSANSSTPSFVKQLLTPLSSGYNSTARSRENLLLTSSFISSISSGDEAANNSSSSSNGINYSSLKVKLFEDDDDDDEMLTDNNELNVETPMRSMTSSSAGLQPELVRIKEQRRQVCQANSRRKFANKSEYSSIIKSLRFHSSSSPDLTQL